MANTYVRKPQDSGLWLDVLNRLRIVETLFSGDYRHLGDVRKSKGSVTVGVEQVAEWGQQLLADKLGNMPIRMDIPDDEAMDFYDITYWKGRQCSLDPRFDIERVDLVLRRKHVSDEMFEALRVFVSQALKLNSEFVLRHMIMTNFDWAGILNFKHNKLGDVFVDALFGEFTGDLGVLAEHLVKTGSQRLSTFLNRTDNDFIDYANFPPSYFSDDEESTASEFG